MSTSTLSAVDANTGNKIPLATFSDATGDTVVGHVVLAGTPLVPVAPGNPLPVTDASAEAALSTLGINTAATMAAAGTPGDAAWDGTGSGTLVALLKALYGGLAGTLTTTVSGVTTVSGSAAIGTNSVDPPLAVSGVDAQGLTRHVLTDGNGVLQVAQAAPLPAGTNTIGSVAVSGTPTVTVGNLPATQPVSGTVIVGNLPATQAVSGTVALAAGSQAIGTVGIAGTVAVADSAAEASLVTIGTNTAGAVMAAGTPGDVAWAGAGPGSLIALIKALYGKLAGTLTASLTGPLPPGTNALGSVSVSNLPATQPVSGSISISNLPAIQSVSGTVALAAGSQAIGTVAISGTVAVADSAGDASLAIIATNTTPPAPRVLVSRSVASTAASASNTLAAANAARRLLRVEAPQGAGVWLNLLGGTAGNGLVDCLYLAPGDVFEGVDTNAVTYWCATGGLVLSAWEA